MTEEEFLKIKNIIPQIENCGIDEITRLTELFESLNKILINYYNPPSTDDLTIIVQVVDKSILNLKLDFVDMITSKKSQETLDKFNIYKNAPLMRLKNLTIKD